MTFTRDDQIKYIINSFAYLLPTLKRLNNYQFAREIRIYHDIANPQIAWACSLLDSLQNNDRFCIYRVPRNQLTITEYEEEQ